MSVFLWLASSVRLADQEQRFSHPQITPTIASSTTASNAAVTMRLNTTECADSSAACNPKNRLRRLAQRSMWDANAAVSVDTKSSGFSTNVVGLVKVVMVCSECVKGDCVALGF